MHNSGRYYATMNSKAASSFYVPSTMTQPASGSSRSLNRAPNSSQQVRQRQPKPPQTLRSESIDGNYDDNEDEQTAQANSIVQELLKQWEHKYSTYKDVRTFVGTFNLNGKAPTQSLRPWLATGVNTPPDLYAIGFQELDLNTTAYIVDNPKREIEWRQATMNALHPGAKYELVAFHKLIGIYLLLAVRSDAKLSVTDVTTNAIPTGFMSVLARKNPRSIGCCCCLKRAQLCGNKGGVGISLKVNDTRLCFVSSHLAAHLDEVDRRNQDFRDICSKLRFGPGGVFSVFDHDALIWLGDLNYRLDHLTTPDVKKYTAAGEFDLMLEHDQLKAVQRRRQAFQNFFEAPILFAPTYKYDPGTDTLDSSEKQRPPAWTDRVLYLASGTRIRTTAYESVMSIRTSDHKPVRCTMDVQVKSINTAELAKYHSQALAELDRRANELLPQLSLDRHEFDFGMVKFMQPVVLSLTCRNKGKSAAEYRFRVPPDRHSICRQWLQITPEHRSIPKGEECTIDLQVLVDKTVAWALDNELNVLEDMLVLHLRAGRDYFIALRAAYQPSVFGQSLQKVVDKQQQQAQKQPLISLDTTDGSAEGPSEPIPRPLWLLVERVIKHHLDDPDIFHVTGSASDFALIRDWLDDGGCGAFPSLQCGVHSLVEAIERYLDCLPDAVVPAKYTNTFLAAAPNSATCQQALKLLPPDNRATFDYLINFMGRVLCRANINRWDIWEFSKLWAPFLFRLDVDTTTTTLASTTSSATHKSTSPGGVSGSVGRQLDTAARFIMNSLVDSPAARVSWGEALDASSSLTKSQSGASIGQDALALAAPGNVVVSSTSAVGQVGVRPSVSQASLASQPPAEWVTFDR